MEGQKNHTNKCYALTRLDCQFKCIEDACCRPRWIGKRNLIELDLSIAETRCLTFDGTIIDTRCSIEQCKECFRSWEWSSDRLGPRWSGSGEQVELHVTYMLTNTVIDWRAKLTKAKTLNKSMNIAVGKGGRMLTWRCCVCLVACAQQAPVHTSREAPEWMRVTPRRLRMLPLTTSSECARSWYINKDWPSMIKVLAQRTQVTDWLDRRIVGTTPSLMSFVLPCACSRGLQQPTEIHNVKPIWQKPIHSYRTSWSQYAQSILAHFWLCPNVDDEKDEYYRENRNKNECQLPTEPKSE